MEGFAIPLLSVVSALTVALIAIRHQETTKKRDKFAAEYLEFKEAFTELVKCLEGGSSLNVGLLQEYPIHCDARRKFIHNLKGCRLNRFTKKWTEYEEHYKEVECRGPFGIPCAIAPSYEALHSNPSPKEVRQWEVDRKNEVHKVITELLEISNKKIWI